MFSSTSALSASSAAISSRIACGLRCVTSSCRYYPKLTQGYYPEIDPPPTLAEGRIANGIVDVI